MRPTVTDWVAWSVGRSVTLMSLAKTAKPIKCAVWVVGSDGPKESCVRWGTRSPVGRGNFGIGSSIVKYRELQKRLNRSICHLGCGLGWAERSTSSIIFARRRQCTLIGGHIGATWRIRMNRPFATVMRPYVRLLWLLLIIAVTVRFITTRCFVANLNFTDHFSGAGEAIGWLCASVRAITVELNDLWPRYLACWFVMALSRSSSRVKVVGESLWSEDEKCSLFGYDCTLWGDVYILNRQRAALKVHTTPSWMFVEFFVLK